MPFPGCSRPFGAVALSLSFSSLPLVAVIDRDANQLSDIWQLKFSAASLAAGADTDGDGLSNLQESIIGSNPFDASSGLSPRLTPLGPGQLRADWTSALGKLYVLETSTDLVTWTPAATLDGTGDTIANTLNGGPRQFVRVRASDPDTDGDGLSDWEELASGFNPLRMYSEGLGTYSTNTATRVTDFNRATAMLAATTNTVTVAAMDPAMAENWPDPGVVVFRRTGRLDAITINFTLGGSALPGSDYTASATSSVVMPVGADEVYVSFAPVNDAVDEGTSPETILVTLAPGTGYALGATTSATLNIADSTDGKPSEKEAARFLTQATFGPTPVETARVRSLGIAAWLDDQFSRAPNLHFPLVQTWQDELMAAYLATPTNTFTNGDLINVDHRMEAWWRQAMRTDATDPLVPSDPLRQRVAFALSQIFVISDRLDTLNGTQRGMASYQDMLLNNAFGTYRELIESVTLHPLMGIYLTSLRNRKFRTTGSGANITYYYPDENYAREIMQLFSIGLWRLNPDGTKYLSNGSDLDPDGAVVPAGQPVPTYGQKQIAELARVMTGMSYGTRFQSSTNPTEIANGASNFFTGNGVYWRPMRFFDVEHDVAAKSLWLPGHTTLTLPARTAANPDTTGINNAGARDLAATLTWLSDHPNVGPFIGTRLIQRLVTSNPSPAYVARISAVFANDGTGLRGNLRAVVRAILLDPEARDPAKMSDPTHGLVREPYTRYVSFARALEAAPADPIAGGRFRGFGSLDGNFLQRPLSAPSVFNFYDPDYVPQGGLRDASLYSPELQIMNGITAIDGPNRYSTALSVTNTTLSTATPPTNGGYTQINPSGQSDNTATTDVNEALYNTRLNEAPWLVLAKGDVDALVAALDRALCYGKMSPATFRAVTRSVRRQDDPAATGITTLVSDQRARARFRNAVHLIVTSADFSVLK